MKKLAPRINDATAEFLPTAFPTTNAGAEYILDAYPALYKRTLIELRGRFSASELKLMLDVFNGTMLTSGISGQHLEINCIDGMELDALDTKWGVDKTAFAGKLKSITIFQAACLEVWANGFWYAEKSAADETGSVEKYVEGLV